MTQRRTSTKGFKRTGTLIGTQVRTAAESRGFAQSRLLTHWAETVGRDIATIARPVEVSYGRGGMGATLIVLTTGPNAPLLDMQKETLRERINAAYGYNAISRIRVTQTAPTGFAEGQVSFDMVHATKTKPEPKPETRRAAADLARPVTDETLRSALVRLAENVLARGDNQRTRS